MVCFAVADSCGGGGVLDSFGAAADSFAMVGGAKACGCCAGALEVGFTAGVASCRNDLSQNSGEFSWPSAASAALLQPVGWDCGYCRHVLDSVADYSLVLVWHAHAGSGPRAFRDRFADVAGRADREGCGCADGVVSYFQRAGLQYEHGAGWGRNWHAGGRLRRAADHREFVWRRFS